MSFSQFPDLNYFRVLESDAITKLGSLQVPVGTELDSFMMTMFIRGVLASPVNFRLKIFGSNTVATAEITSAWVVLSTATLDSTPAYTQNWFGNFYVDFNGEPLNPNTTYYLSCETSGYTRNANTFYIAANLDWSSPVNVKITPNRAAARFRILGRR